MVNGYAAHSPVPLQGTQSTIKEVNMDKEKLTNHLKQLSGMNRPTKKEMVDGQEVDVEQWSESDTAQTIQTIIADNERLERELKESRERYINDFLSAPNTEDAQTHGTPPTKAIAPTDYLDF